MWKNPLTQQNLSHLQSLLSDSLVTIEPDHGIQACGDNGPGRLPEPEVIIEKISTLFQSNKADVLPKLLVGKSVVITAGPTREAIDPVRYISNHSSGKMGYALAAACASLGANVKVVTGPCALSKTAGIDFIDVQSAIEMYGKVHEAIDVSCDIFIACAAVADYRPISMSDQKIKKTAQGVSELVIRLEENPDIVASVASRTDRPFTVGFAAETQNVNAYAKDKLKRKKLDMIVANDVSLSGQGFNSDFNQVTLITRDDERVLALQEKQALAQEIVAYIAKRYLNT